MSQLVINGKTVKLNEEGFLSDPSLWDDDVARHLAKLQEGLDVLLADHWAIVRFIRGHYVKTGRAPTVRSLCTATGLPLRRIYELFPSGPAKGACKIAGLPKPDGCA